MEAGIWLPLALIAIHDATRLPQRADLIPGVGRNEPRRDNNLRVIEAFRRGTQLARQFNVLPRKSCETQLANVLIRATPDLCVEEDGERRYMLYDCRAVECDEEIVRTTIELFHHVLAASRIGWGVIPKRGHWSADVEVL